MARDPDSFDEENSEQRDADQAQDVGDEAISKRSDLTVGSPHDPTTESEHGRTANPAAIIPEDMPDLVDTMNQMLTSGLIDNGAYAREPMMDDEEEILGQTDGDSDDDL